MAINMDFKLHNKFEISCYNTGTGETKTQTCYNLITNIGIDKAARLELQINQLLFGSGTGTPAVTDTDLINRIYSVYCYSPDFDFSESENGIVTRIDKHILQTTEIPNTVITEIGYLCEGGLFNHAMIEPPIHKGELDIITVTATIYLVSRQNFVYGDGSIFLTPSGASALLGCSGTAIKHSSSSFYLRSGHEDTSDTRTGATIIYTPENNTSTLTARWEPHQGDVKEYGHISYEISIAYTKICLFYLQAITSEFIKTCNSIKGENIGTGDGTNKEFSVLYNWPHDFVVYKNGIIVDKTEYMVNEFTFKNGVPCYAIRKINMLALDKFTGDEKKRSSSVKDRFVVENLSCEYGVSGIFGTKGGLLEVSEDGENWIITTDSLPEEHRKSRFFRYTVAHQDSSGYVYRFLFYVNSEAGKVPNIIFNEPPAAGDIITVDYFTESIPKSATNRLDLTLQITVDTDTSPI